MLDEKELIEIIEEALELKKGTVMSSNTFIYSC